MASNDRQDTSTASRKSSEADARQNQATRKNLAAYRKEMMKNLTPLYKPKNGNTNEQ